METTKRWHHSPEHRFAPGLTYMVTAATLHKKHCFADSEALRHLETVLLKTAEEYGWHLDEWSVFSNHYHFVGLSEVDAEPVSQLERAIHSKTAIWLNQRDNQPGRPVWYQYWDTCITYESSYYARLNYVHNNPVSHGLVARPEDYPFCSAARLLIDGISPRHRRMRTYQYDRLTVPDDFDPIWSAGACSRSRR